MAKTVSDLKQCAAERMKSKTRSVLEDRKRIFATEFRLALACCRWNQTEKDLAEIRRLANQSVDWRWFKRIVERNQIVPLVYRNLHGAFAREDQPEILGSLREGARSQAGLSLSQAAELVRIVEALRGAGIRTVALKGVSLSVSAYGSCSMRSSGDIDLLVSPADIFAVESILRELEYTRCDPKAPLTPKQLEHYLRYHKHFTYFSKGQTSLLEVHWRLFDSIELYDDTSKFPETTPLLVGRGFVPTLARNELFLYLCVHGAIHGWSILKWLADVGAMLSVMTADDLERIATLAFERGLTAELDAALLLVEGFLSVKPPNVEFPDKSSPAMSRITRMARRLLTAKDYCLEVNRPPKLAMFVYDLRFRPSWRHKSECIRRALFLPADWSLIHLPDGLFPVYTAIRPVSWLVRHLRVSARQQKQ